MATNHGGDPVGSILGPMGSHWVQKMGQNHKRLPCPKMRIFDYPAVIDFLPKMEVTVMVTNHGGDPLGSILGSMGSHWVKKWVKTIKNYHAPKFAFSTTPRSSIFPKKWKLRLWPQTMVGTPYGPFWGQWGPIGSRKLVKTVEIHHVYQNSHFWLPRGHRFFVKNGSYGYGDKSRWGPPRVNLGVNGVPLGPKMGQNHKKNYHAPKFAFSTTLLSTIFCKK